MGEVPDECPVCHYEVLLSADMPLLRSICKHIICGQCRDKLFVAAPGETSTQARTIDCIMCRRPLRYHDFVLVDSQELRSHLQQAVKSEAAVRKRVRKVLNKRESDFASLGEWDTYLELIEDTIFDLVEGSAAERAMREEQLAAEEATQREDILSRAAAQEADAQNLQALLQRETRERETRVAQWREAEATLAQKERELLEKYSRREIDRANKTQREPDLGQVRAKVAKKMAKETQELERALSERLDGMRGAERELSGEIQVVGGEALKGSLVISNTGQRLPLRNGNIRYSEVSANTLIPATPRTPRYALDYRDEMPMAHAGAAGHRPVYARRRAALEFTTALNVPIPTPTPS